MAAAAILNFGNIWLYLRLDEDTCTKFCGKMQRGHAEMIKSQNRKFICVTSSNECREQKAVYP